MASNPTHVTTHELDGIAYLEHVTHADASSGDLPCVLVLHWMSGHPQAMLPICASFAQPARFLLPFATHPDRDGYAWFTDEFYQQPLAEQGVAIRATADRLAAFLRAVTEQTPCRGKPAVMGMSQGGDLSYALALYHPQTISAALPLAGRLEPEFRPAADALPTPPHPGIWIFHGEADPIVPVAHAHEAAAWLQEHGFAAKLHTYPEVGHDISRSMVADIHRVFASL